MLNYLDTTLKNLLTAELQGQLPTVPYIYFNTPDADFPGQLSLPALNLFLFTVQENRALRDTDPTRTRLSDGSVQRQDAPVRLDCNYIVTAYANAPETDPESPITEHRILGETIRVLLRYANIPPQYYAGPITVQGLPVRAMTATPTTREMGIDLWQSLGQKPRACFHYLVTVSLDTNAPLVNEFPVEQVVLQAPLT